MTDRRYGPDRPCRRPACVRDDPATAETAAHLGGAHLDPHDRERFDGVRIAHITAKIRDDLYALLAARTGHPDLAEIIDTAVVRATDEIDFLGQQVAHVQVDADHKVRDAMRRSESCDHHGAEIRELSRQLHHLDEERQRTERQRIALLGLTFAIREFTAAARDRQKLDQPLPDPEEIIAALERAEKKTTAAHDRAGRTRPKKEKIK